MTLWLITDVDVEFDSLRFDQGFFSKNKSLNKAIRRHNPGLIEGVPKLLEFFNKYDINATFHIQEQEDPAFSVLFNHPKVYDLVEDYNQEISLHVHMKEADYCSRKKEISAGFDRQKKQGYKVSSFRAGSYFINENTVKVLEELGVDYDCSPIKNFVVGSMRFYDIPDSPYHPNYADVTRIGNAEVLIIPVTNSRLGIAIHEDNDFELELMKKGVQALYSASEKIEQPVIIYFTTHSWKLFNPNGSEREWEARRRRGFFRFLKDHDVTSLSVCEAGSLWKEKGYESYFLDLPDLVGSYRSIYNPLRHFRLVKHVLSRIYTLKYRLLGEP